MSSSLLHEHMFSSDLDSLRDVGQVAVLQLFRGMVFRGFVENSIQYHCVVHT